MLKVLFVVALPIELKIIKQEIKKIILKDIKVDYLLSWAGNYETIYNLKDYINKNWNPDFLVNLWVCGYVNNVIPANAGIYEDNIPPFVKGDRGFLHFNNENNANNQLIDPRIKSEDDISFIQIYRIKNLSDNKEKICPVYVNFWDLQSIACSEKIITDKTSILDEKFVDMESFWVDFIATNEKVPYIILKIPFDEIWKESKKVDLKDLENSFLSFPYEKLFLDIKNYLQKNEKKEKVDLSFYKDYFRLTFSEFEILKRNYNKFIAYKQDFEDFFEKNKELSKEKFLEKLQKK